MFPEHLQQPVIGWALRAPVLFYRDRRIAVGGRLSDLITLARFFPKDAIVNALRFFVGHAARFHVALQGGTAPSPLGLDGPLVLKRSPTASGTPCRNSLAGKYSRPFCLHCSLF